MPIVQLEYRPGNGQPVLYDVGDGGFLIGSVPGCDLRLPGIGLPPVLCLIGRSAATVSLRKLAPACPILVNGELVSTTQLADGDCLTVVGVSAIIRIQALTSSAEPEPTVAVSNQRPDQEPLAGEHAQLAESLRRQQKELDSRAEQIIAQKQALDTAQHELAELREQLYRRYRQRRDRLAGLQEAVAVAARKIQERKRLLDQEEKQAQERRQTEADMLGRAEQINQALQQIDAERRSLAEQREAVERDHEARVAVHRTAQEQLVTERLALEQGQARYQADLVRMDRLQADLERRQQQVEIEAQQVRQRGDDLTQARLELQEQTRRLREREQALQTEAQRIEKQTADSDATLAQLSKRASDLDGQQAMLAALRTRLDRLREELRRDEHELTEQRARQEATEIELRQQRQEFEQLRAEAETEQRFIEQQRAHFQERSQVLDEAVTRLQQAQQEFAVEQEQLRVRQEAVDATSARQAEETELVRAKTAQLAEQQRRLTADLQSLRDREAALSRAEQARDALQEQLRRRAEELSSRQRALTEQAKQLEQQTSTLVARLAEIEALKQLATQELHTLRETAAQELAHDREELLARQATLEAREDELALAATALAHQVERLRACGRLLGSKRKALRAEDTRLRAEQRQLADRAIAAQTEADEARRQAQELLALWPDLEQKAQAAVDRLTHAREQLRGHLAELHTYARQGREDLEALRQQVRTEAEHVRQQEQALHRVRDEHRLATAAFRQQLIDWQGQVSELKRSLAADETRLERRQAAVDRQARQVDETTARLAQQAVHLQDQERAVLERRHEMERHLADMREWYRRKLRELSERQSIESRTPLSGSASRPATDRSILTLTGDLDPGDRQLGDVLRGAELIEPETLTALLVEARKQRRSLRQLLLTGGYLTLYQIALIEAGNLDALILGPVRVIDRLRVTPREAVFRVFDPRRSREAILRHLGESEAGDAVHPDEFRQRFAAAARLEHAHLAGTLEVLDVAGRPAVLLEWLVGLPSTDWPDLAAAPGVLLRLLTQAAQALQAAHDVGLVHGHLRPASILMTTEGILKVCGLGEPPWLANPPADEEEATIVTDLLDLGRLATAWAGGARKVAKAKSLQAILDKLAHDTVEMNYASAAHLLLDLEGAAADTPTNSEAWERLLRHIRTQLEGDRGLRQSA